MIVDIKDCPVCNQTVLFSQKFRMGKTGQCYMSVRASFGKLCRIHGIDMAYFVIRQSDVILGHCLVAGIFVLILALAVNSFPWKRFPLKTGSFRMYLRKKGKLFR